MTDLLREMIQEASEVLGPYLCSREGHDWETEGGRSCPKELDISCSQTVYRCRTCGEYDYGDRQSYPGYKQCFVRCKEEQ